MGFGMRGVTNFLKITNKIRLFIGIMLLIMMMAAPFYIPLQTYVTIPNNIVTLNDKTPIDLPDLGKAVKVSSTEESVYALDSSNFYTNDTGESELVYEAFGMPVKKVDVSVLDDIKVIPGGQSIGVQLETKGVLVVGHHLVNGQEGTASPGEKADIKVGDIILKINNDPIKKMEDIMPYVKKAGENNDSLDLTIKRGKSTMETTLQPVMDQNEKEFRLGLYIRDSAAGIGTLSFYEPKSKKYGALGHIISDMDTKKPIEINQGKIVKSSVTSIEKGNHGTPGEKQAKFSINKNYLGTITKNSPFGIFGKLDDTIKNNHYDEPMSIALSHEVKEGPAKILTVVEGEKVEEFDVEVVSTTQQKYPATKGMVIKITDKDLLNRTGGIVQGMSGSPIIQDEKVIGAVTHVFVNDPTSGYGVHIEWMLEEAGIEVRKQQKEAS